MVGRYQSVINAAGGKSKKKKTTSQHQDRDRLRVEDEYGVIHSRTERLSSRGSLLQSATSPQKGRNPWRHGVESWVHDDPTFALSDSIAELHFAVEEEYAEQKEHEEEMENATKRKTRKRSKKSRRANLHWQETYRSQFLDELIRGDGRGDAMTLEFCPDCTSNGTVPPRPAEIRCIDCTRNDLVCTSCCCERHKHDVFHRIERWNGSSFSKSTLGHLGLTMQLNHLTSPCSNPIPAHSRLLILDINGPHRLTIYFCGCERRIAHHLQLLRRRLYPATQDVIQTCASFRYLDFLHIHSLTLKTSTLGFYQALEHQADNTGVSARTSRYEALKRMLTQWRHLLMLKRAGRGHDADPMRIENTRPGELAVKCPSCPRPGVNLEEGWELTPPEHSYVHRPILAMDANFRLKNQLVSSWSRSPGLGIGWGYFVGREEYEAYIKLRSSDEDISTCVGFAALAKAATMFSRGLRYTGVCAVSCGRMDMIITVGNLEKGERYANMDFVFGNAVLQFSDVRSMLVSYDICCQWFTNLFTRTAHWPRHLRRAAKIAFVPAIPKFHEPAHGQKDHEKYSFNLIPGAAITNAEGPERIWSKMNPLSMSTKPMAPGGRIIVLDDNFGFWNWVKYSGHGRLLMKKYVDAIKERNIQVDAHEGWTARLPKDLVDSWEALCVAWENAPHPKDDVENPFAVSDEFLDEEKALEELELEDAAKARAASRASLSTLTAPGFVSLGLQLEQLQRELLVLIKQQKKNNDRNARAVKDRREMLREKMRAFEVARPTFMPGLLQILLELGEDFVGASDEQVEPETVKLWLPSDIPEHRRKDAFLDDLVEVEDRLRTGQCQDALHSIQHTLRVKSRMITFKRQNIRGQRDNMKSRAIIDRVHDRLEGFVQKYRAARSAKETLIGSGSWEDTLRVLNDGDIRSYRDQAALRARAGRRGVNEDSWEPAQEQPVQEDVEGMGIDLRTQTRAAHGEHPHRRAGEAVHRWEGTGETRKVNSWIWTSGPGMQQLNDGADEGNEVCREEWCRSRARMHRALEEVALVKVEMARTMKTLEFDERRWEQLGKDRADSEREPMDEGLKEGLRAYAHKQESLFRRLQLSFRDIWRTPLDEAKKQHDLDRRNWALDLTAANEEDEIRGNDENDDGADAGNDSDDSDDSEGTGREGGIEDDPDDEQGDADE